MSLEQLMNVEVTTVSKQPEKFSTAPAAIYVISQEDLQRSGATSIAEALRMVPGMEVAQINPSTWAISSRGFNSVYANKLQVLIDGRSVYTPLFSGVNWDTISPMMENIERIEVIRGPGASLWGANAVNGVINIITKNSKDTQGGLIVAGGGTEERGFGAIRYGGKIDDTSFFRVAVKYMDRDSNPLAGNQNGFNGMDLIRGGFRVDLNPSVANDYMFQGNYFTGHTASGAQTDFNDVSGGDFMGRWSHTFSDTSDLSLQASFMREKREFGTVLTNFRNTLDVDFQHRFALGDWNQFIWGAAYRLTSDNNFGSPTLSFVPTRSTDHVRSLFLQDDMTLLPETLHFIAGTKLEYNDYTGLEVQPNARLQWTPTKAQTVWASVSRAVRSPSRAEDAIQAYSPVAPGVLTGVFGSPDFSSETELSYELGYRIYPRNDLSFDIATFYSEYDHLRSFSQGTPYVSGANLIVPLTVNNMMAGETYGAEFSATWQVTHEWKLTGSYTLLQMHLRHALGLNDSTLEASAMDNPQNQFQVRSYLDLPYHFQLDTSVYYVDSLPGQGVASNVKMDVRLGWQPTPRFEASVVVQNVLEQRHFEYGPNFLVTPAQPERGVYGKLTWRF